MCVCVCVLCVRACMCVRKMKLNIMAVPLKEREGAMSCHLQVHSFLCDDNQVVSYRFLPSGVMCGRGY